MSEETLLDMETVEKRWLSRELVSLYWTEDLAEVELDSRESSRPGRLRSKRLWEKIHGVNFFTKTNSAHL